MTENTRSILNSIRYGFIIILLLVVINNGNQHANNHTEYRRYNEYVENDAVSIDYQKLEEYSAEQEQVEPTDSNVMEGTPDPSNTVFQTDAAIYDVPFIQEQVNLVEESSSDTDWAITCDIGNYRLTVLNRVDGAWKPIACFSCGVGSKDSPTTVGVYKVQKKFARWGGLSWVLWYYSENNSYDKIGEQHGIHTLYNGYSGEYSTLGDICLANMNAHFLYDNVPDNSTMIIHS